MAVLRRIWVQTPPSEGPLFACRPVIDLAQVAPLHFPAESIEVLRADQRAVSAPHRDVQEDEEGLERSKSLEGPALAASDKAVSELTGRARVPEPLNNASGATTGGGRLGQLQITPCDEVIRLPPDSLCVITLPQAYAAPLMWLVPYASASSASLFKSVDKPEPLTARETKDVICPIIPIREAWPFTAKVAKGTILFPCRC